MIKIGDRVTSHRHRCGLIEVVRISRGGVVGRPIRKRDGRPSVREVVVYNGELREVELMLPGVKACA